MSPLIDDAFPGKVAKIHGVYAYPGPMGQWTKLIPWFRLALDREEYDALVEATPVEETAQTKGSPVPEWFLLDISTSFIYVIATPTPEMFEGWSRPTKEKRGK